VFIAALLIGLREGLEASLIVGILVAYLTKRGRLEQRRQIGAGVALAVLISLALGALFTFGSYRLSFTAQEIIGGTMSLVAVALVTWMVFWMLKLGRRMKVELESRSDDALATGARWAMFGVAFVAVAREGIETTLILWGWALEPAALSGALLGFAISIGVGYLVYRGMLRINFATFFAWTGVFLVIVAAGILAYGIADLQEARVLPGPFSGHPITPTDFRTGEVLTGLTDGPFWLASVPFGWAFDVSASIDPSSAAAAFLKGTVGFTPQMSWVQVIAWLLYVVLVLPPFWRRAFANVAAAKAAQAARQPQAAQAAETAPPAPAVPARHPAGVDHAPAGPLPVIPSDATAHHRTNQPERITP